MYSFLKIKKALLLFLVLGFSMPSFSQSKKVIDSINSIPFPIKTAQAASLNSVYQKNLEDALKIDYKIGIGQSYSNLALINYYQGALDEDLNYSLQAISTFEKAGALEFLAREYGETGYRMKRRNLQKAEYYLQKGKKIAEKGNFENPLLSIYNNYGTIKELLQQKDSALYFFQKGLVMKERINDSIGIPYSLNNIAGIYVSKNEFSKARIYYERALKIRIAIQDEIGIVENYTYFGDLLLAENNPKEAIVNYQTSLKKSLRYHYPDMIQYNYKKLAECYEKLGLYNEAFSNFKLYSTYKDSILNQETNDKIAELEIKYEAAKKQKLLLESQAETKQKSTAIFILILVAAFILLISLSIYRQQKLKNKQQQQEFELKNIMATVETQNKLQNQRLSISRDLHDNIGAQLTFIISSIDNIKFAFPMSELPINKKLTRISDFARATIIELRDTIWAMNSNEITFEDLHSRILNFVEKAQHCQESIQFRFTVPNDLKEIKFSSVTGMNLYRTIQEAVNNAIKHAFAKNVVIEISSSSNMIQITITDDGIGYDTKELSKGNGLLSMEKRIHEIGGEINFYASENDGTRIEIQIKK
ncbi:ATP-binding protein [Flavobacterium antarcticum]|uniref:tetratricopeptide repeat-containing sensor histidine kinase n=1 Tax=Flavobacterium antarcticum TaxID=271155 RepID=UPI0003B43DAF|nr:ATP-binding protein [Flavobacterium antarcticum]